MLHASASQFRQYLWSDGNPAAIAEGGKGFRRLALLSAAATLFLPAILLPLHAEEEAATSAMIAKAPHPLIGKYCMSCHDSADRTANLAFDEMSLAQPGRNAEMWEAAIRRLSSGLMPPAGSPRPSASETGEMIQAISSRLDAVNAAPAAAVVRRLTRTEYANVVRDLLGLRVDTTTLLPPDPSTKGFDNIGEILTTSPALVQGYLNAGMRISRLAVGDPSMTPARRTFPIPQKLDNSRYIEGQPLGTRGGARVNVLFPVEGDYEIEIRSGPGTSLFRKYGGGQMPHVDLTVAGKGFAVDKKGKTWIHARAGEYPLTASLRDVDLEPGADELFAKFNVKGMIMDVAVSGPFNVRGVGSTVSRKKIFSCYPRRPMEERTCARMIIAQLAGKAFRKPMAEQAPEMDPLMRYYDQGRRRGNFETGIQQALAYILVDPRFLYRVEQEPAGAVPGNTYAVTPIELATRLSFLLWSSIPDEALLASAASGMLAQPAELERQVRRMIADPRSDAFVDNFAGQWLGLRQIAAAERESPDFDDNLKFAMEQETKLLFANVMRRDRPTTELLNADYTFLNERLARHYGIAGVRGDYFRRVALPEGSPRRGILGQGSILTVTSVADRTSPVIRGAWVLENILGVPPSPPPPGVETNLDESVKAPTTLRERLAMHRANPACASCHNMMDPIGLSMENFDQTGKWRLMDGKFPIITTSAMVDGTKLRDSKDLKTALLRHSDSFVSNVTTKLMTFAIGRPVGPHEMPAVREVTARAKRNGGGFVSLILGVVESQPFLTRTQPKPVPLGRGPNIQANGSTVPAKRKVA